MKNTTNDNTRSRKRPKADTARRSGDTSARPRKRRRWGRRILVILLVLVAAYTLFGFFGVPLLIRTVAMSRLSERLNGTAAIERATFNPFTLRLVIEDFTIEDDAGVRQVAFEHLDANVQLVKTVFQDGYHVRHARLRRPVILLERDPEGDFNLAELWIASGESSEPLREIPRLVASDITISDAEVVARDESLPERFERTISRINISLPNVDTAEDVENAHQLTAEIEGGATISWQGSLFIDPFTSKGTVTIDGADITPYMPYARPFTNARVTRGTLSVELSYDFAPVRQPRRASLMIDVAELEALVVELEDEELVTLPGVEIAGATLDADTQRVTVDRVNVREPDVVLRRGEEGAWQLQALLERDESSPADTLSRVPATDVSREPEDIDAIEYPLRKLHAGITNLVRDAIGPWDLEVTAFTVNDARVNLIDHSREPVVELQVVDANVDAGPIRFDQDHLIPYDVSFVLSDGGTMHLAGEAAARGERATVSLEAQDLELPQFAPFIALAQLIPDARLASGRLGVSGSGEVVLGDGEVIRTTFEGRMNVQSMDVASATSDRHIARFEQLDIDGMNVQATRAAGGVPMLEWRGDIDLKSGSLEWPLAGGLFADAEHIVASIDLLYDQTTPDGPEVRLSGRGSVGGGHVRLPESNDLDASVHEASLTGIDVDLKQRVLQFESVALAAPAVRLKAEILPSETPAEETADPGTTRSLAEQLAAYRSDGGLGYLLRLDQFSISAGTIEITDVAADPPVTLLLDSLEMQASKIANDGGTVADLTVTSNVQGTGQANVSGKIDPFRSVSPYADMTVGISGLPLQPYDPYAGHYVGYLIESGRATLTLPLRMEDGTLSGTLDADLSRLRLGEKTNSRVAPDAPIKLGLDLVRDPDDHIRTEIAFKGDLNDPQFRVGEVIWNEFLDFLLRGATAPFRLLASVFADNEDIDLSVLTFEPGTTRLTADATEKIDVLGTALNERPALRLAIVGRTAEADLEPLRAGLLEQRLLERLRRTDPSVRSLTPERRAEAVKLLFADVFPDRVTAPVPVPPGRLEQGVPPAAMEAALLTTVEVSDAAAAALADRRADRVIEALKNEYAIDAGRLMKADRLASPAVEHTGPRVDLELF